MEQERSDLERAKSGDMNLYGADLYGADLGSANLGRANLDSADLYDANLRDANLGGANLGGANLRGADLRGANLYDANLRGADLRGANLPTTSHDAISEILRTAAASNIQYRMIAGLVIISRDMCWQDFANTLPEQDFQWALSVLAQWECFVEKVKYYQIIEQKEETDATK